MPRNVRCALIQASNALSTERPLAQIRKAMIDKHLKLIEQAARKKAQILCLQELFYGPYFCAEQNARWYDLTERVPDGPTTRLMQKVAAKHRMVMVVPVYEEQMPGVYFNTAAVIDADGRYLGKYRKHHLPHCHPGFWEKFYFTPGDLGYPVFETKYARVGVYICYDRHFRPLRWRVCRNTCGSWNNLLTPWRTDILWERSTAWEQRSRGVSANFTARAISAIPGARSSLRPAAIKMKWWSRISTWT
jgi:predicted amidohydrolase